LANMPSGRAGGRAIAKNFSGVASLYRRMA